LALKVMKGEAVDMELIEHVLEMARAEVEGVLSSYEWREGMVGRVMTYQHMLLSRYYGVSLPVIDELVDFLVSEGAYGAKLSGAGLGGAVIALIRNGDMAKELLNRASKRGLAVRGWVVDVDEGVLVHGG
jgi:Galactokinase